MKGSVTIFLSFTLILILSLMMVLLESTRVNGLKTVEKVVGNAAAESTMASFAKQAFERYGLLLVDGGYGKDWLDEEGLIDDFSYYYQESLSAYSGIQSGNLFSVKGVVYRINEMNFLTDQNGEPFVQEVLAFYPYEAAGILLQKLKGYLSGADTGSALLEQIEDKDNERKSTDWDQYLLEEKNQRMLLVSKSFQVMQTAFNQDQYEENIKYSPIGKAEETEKSGWLSLVMPSKDPLSGKKIDKATFPSETVIRTKQAADSIYKNELYQVIFDEYLLSNFNCYTNCIEESGVQYEVEYIIAGKESDETNLKATLSKIALMREGMNLLYLYNDAEKNAEARLMATALCGWTQIPLLIELTKFSLLAAWAYAETILDIRTLLMDQRIPLYKSKNTWTLQLSQVSSFLSGGEIKAKSVNNGLSYQDYLRLLLLLQNFEDSSFKTMDMIQERLMIEQPNFRMENALYEIEFDVEALTTPLFSQLNFVLNQFNQEKNRYLIHQTHRYSYL